MRHFTSFVLAVLVAALTACSTVGPGLAHHPLDCAMGVKWADCLPGTPGYNNGGGQQTRAEEAQQNQNNAQAANAKMQGQARELVAQCKASYETPDLDPIRQKVELLRESTENAPPFEIATNSAFPDSAELPAISRWAKLREECDKRYDEWQTNQNSSGDQIARTNGEMILSMRHELSGRVSELLVSLYQQKLTYGEFAQKRYEFGRDESRAEKQMFQAIANADQQHQMQARELAEKEYQARTAAWSAYTQSVTQRQPQTVILQANPTPAHQTNCTSIKTGDTVQTYCN